MQTLAEKGHNTMNDVHLSELYVIFARISSIPFKKGAFICLTTEPQIILQTTSYNFRDFLTFSLSMKRYWFYVILTFRKFYQIFTFYDPFYEKKSDRFAGTFSSLASLSAPRARDLIIALRARSCALRIHLSLFLII